MGFRRSTDVTRQARGRPGLEPTSWPGCPRHFPGRRRQIGRRGTPEGWPHDCHSDPDAWLAQGAESLEKDRCRVSRGKRRSESGGRPAGDRCDLRTRTPKAERLSSWNRSDTTTRREEGRLNRSASREDIRASYADERSGRFGNETASEATCTSVDVLRGAIEQCLDVLEVGELPELGLDVRVGHFAAHESLFFADKTRRHDIISFVQTAPDRGAEGITCILEYSTRYTKAQIDSTFQVHSASIKRWRRLPFSGRHDRVGGQ